MRLRDRIDTEINARIATLMPEAARTVWDKSGVVVLIESATFTVAGGVDAGFDRIYTVNGKVRVDLRTDDLANIDLSQELLADLLGRPVFLKREQVATGMLTETARVVLQEFRVLAREATLVQQLTFTLSGEVLRFIGPGTVPQTVAVPPPFDGVAA
jgi:hypothetical protein